MTPAEFRRALAVAMESRAAAEALMAQLERTPAVDADSLRQRALTAWRAAEADERIVRTAPLEVIARAIAKAKREEAAPCGDMPPLTSSGNSHMSTDEMCTVMQYVEAGYTIVQIGEMTGRSHKTLGNAIRAWRKGTSRCAQRAQLRGLWPSGVRS